MRGRRWLGVLRGNEEDGEFLGGGLGALFLLRRGDAPGRESRRGGTRRDGRVDGVRAGTGRKRMSAQGWKTKRRG